MFRAWNRFYSSARVTDDILLSSCHQPLKDDCGEEDLKECAKHDVRIRNEKTALSSGSSEPSFGDSCAIDSCDMSDWEQMQRRRCNKSDYRNSQNLCEIEAAVAVDSCVGKCQRFREHCQRDGRLRAGKLTRTEHFVLQERCLERNSSDKSCPSIHLAQRANSGEIELSSTDLFPSDEDDTVDFDELRLLFTTSRSCGMYRDGFGCRMTSRSSPIDIEKQGHRFRLVACNPPSGRDGIPELRIKSVNKF